MPAEGTKISHAKKRERETEMSLSTIRKSYLFDERGKSLKKHFMCLLNWL